MTNPEPPYDSEHLRHSKSKTTRGIRKHTVDLHTLKQNKDNNLLITNATLTEIR